MPRAAWEEMVVVGRVARPHGTRGAVLIDPQTDFPEARFRPGRAVFVRRGAAAVALTVEAARVHQGRPLVTFREVRTLTEAEALAGAELRVPETDLEPLPPGSFYRHALVGCRVLGRDGSVVGTVVRIEGERDWSRLVVETASGEVLVPFAAAICVRIDPAAREIVIDPPEGLLDVNR
jgi:16S rRNA processing protein RimM